MPHTLHLFHKQHYLPTPLFLHTTHTHTHACLSLYNLYCLSILRHYLCLLSIYAFFSPMSPAFCRSGFKDTAHALALYPGFSLFFLYRIRFCLCNHLSSFSFPAHRTSTMPSPLSLSGCSPPFFCLYTIPLLGLVGSLHFAAPLPTFTLGLTSHIA